MSLPTYANGGSSGDSGDKSTKYAGKLKSGEMFEFVALTGIEPPDGEATTGKNCVISYLEYTLWKKTGDGTFSPSFPKLPESELAGRVDPGIALNLQPRLRCLMLVVPKGEEEAKIYAFTKSVFDQLRDIEGMLGDSLKGQVIRVSRKGDTQLNTKYKVMAVGKRVEIEGEPDLDIGDFCNPLDTYEKIVAKLSETGDWPPEGYTVDGYKEGAVSKSKKSTKGKSDDDFAYSEED